MISYLSLTSGAIFLWLNLTIIGTSTALLTVTALRLLPPGMPRLRYLAALAAFCAALILPVLATLGLTAGPKSSTPSASEARSGSPYTR